MVSTPSETSDDFSSDDAFLNAVLESSPCKSIHDGRASVAGTSDGYQRLTLVDGMMVWRGQSKVLPEEWEQRFCVEAEAIEVGAGTALQHCRKGEKRQSWKWEARTQWKGTQGLGGTQGWGTIPLWGGTPKKGQEKAHEGAKGEGREEAKDEAHEEDDED